jgi:hypothetical protein
MGMATGRRNMTHRYVSLRVCCESRSQHISMQCDRYLFSPSSRSLRPLRTAWSPFLSDHQLLSQQASIFKTLGIADFDEAANPPSSGE